MNQMILTAFFIISIPLFAAQSSQLDSEQPFIKTQKIKIGRFQSRAYWTASKTKAPAILMLPGSGPQGPEEMIPASLTTDGKEAPLFLQMAKPFMEAGFNVLSLGKPGVEFFSGWDVIQLFYDLDLIKNLTWQNLIDNAQDAIRFLQAQDSVDSRKIYVLGHSEGTQLASDLAQEWSFAGLILLGYSGEELLSTMQWQMTDRNIEYFLRPDVDANHDGYISKAEAAKWPGSFAWKWQEGQDEVSLYEIRMTMKADPKLKEILEQTRKSPFCSQAGKCDRGPIYQETAQFGGPLYVFTGALDIQTRPSEAMRLKEVCETNGKKDCFVEIVPYLQHGFSPPKPPRRHPLLDIAVGPVEESFQKRLRELAHELMKD